MAVGTSPGPDITLLLPDKQTANISTSLTALASSYLPLTTTHEPFFLSFSHLTTIYLVIILMPNCPHPEMHWVSIWMFQAGWNMRTRAAPIGIFWPPELHGIKRPVDASGRLNQEDPGCPWVSFAHLSHIAWGTGAVDKEVFAK